MIQIGGKYTIFCQEGGILLQKYRDRKGRCIVLLFKVSGSGVDLILLKLVTITEASNFPLQNQFPEMWGWMAIGAKNNL